MWSIAVNGGNVYVGGDFAYAGGYQINSIAYWDTHLQRWFSVETGGVSGCYDFGTGCDPLVNVVIPTGSGVTIGGNFFNVGISVTAYNVATFDGFNWYALSDGVTNGTNGAIYALYYDGFGWWMSGSFTIPNTELTYFDGTSWYTTGSTLNGRVLAIAEGLGPDNFYHLYVGGYFTNAGPNNASHIAQLTEVPGADWQPLGGGLNGSVTSLAWSGTSLIAGGNFTASGLKGLNYIGRWDPLTQTWSAIGSGTDSTVYSVVGGNGVIYAGGIFHNAGGHSDDSFARWAKFQSFLPLTER